MSKAENIHNTKKWKRRRKNKYGDRCSKAKCGICSYYKNIGNTKKYNTKKQIIETEIENFEKNELNNG